MHESHDHPVGAGAARVVIASELRLLRDGLADALRGRARLHVVASVGDAAAARRAVREHAADTLLLDVGVRDGLSLVRAVSTADSPTRVVVFAVSEREADLVPCIEAGAAGYIGRDGTLDDLVAAVESVRRGETLCSPRLAASLFRRLAAIERERRTDVDPGPHHAAVAVLSPRERQILALIDQGLANKEIGHRLGIELATVKNHVHHILEKLQVTRRGQAAARARPGLTA